MLISWVQDSTAAKGVWVEKLSSESLVIHVYPDVTAAEVMQGAGPVLENCGIAIGWAFGDRAPLVPGNNVERN